MGTFVPCRDGDGRLEPDREFPIDISTCGRWSERNEAKARPGKALEQGGQLWNERAQRDSESASSAEWRGATSHGRRNKPTCLATSESVTGEAMSGRPRRGSERATSARRERAWLGARESLGFHDVFSAKETF